MSNRYLVTVHYSEWIESESEDDALDAMYELMHHLKRHEWEMNVEDQDEAVSDE